MRKKIKVAIVDDSNSYREFATFALKKHKGLYIVIKCSNGKELIDNIPILKEKLDVVLLDITMPIMDGIKTTEYLAKYHPEIKIVILTVHNDKTLSHDLLEKGANIYLLKDNGIEQVADAIYTLFKYEHYFANLSSKKTTPVKIKDITTLGNDTELSSQDVVILKEQERILLKYLCEGLSNKVIADKLCLSQRTIEKRRSKIFIKTNTNNIAALINFAYQNKIIS